MNPEALKLQEAATEVFNKKLFLKILQNWREIICEGVSFNSVFNVFLITSLLKSPTDFCQFYKIFENTFFTEYFGATAFE